MKRAEMEWKKSKIGNIGRIIRKKFAIFVMSGY